MLPVATLENDIMRLSPLQTGDWRQLTDLIGSPGLWDTFPYDLSEVSAFSTWMEERVQSLAAGTWLPHLVFYKKENRAVGLTCYLNIDEANQCIEIGGTWYGAPYQGTEVNPNCKLLMMTQAFEVLDMQRVEYRTDALNLRSRRAILKLGAQQDGILRSQRIVQQGRRRDTVVFSILRSEWPEIKQRLIHRIAATP